ncbi:MAG: phosphatidylserine/phosphatidylglycerophosphate/cardiolipin synthase family protein [Mesorhizobium sp.]|uniref:phospholipase D-like domain-containing protein n=1 Tax=Mesorhizobium sp. TaxID=1871066 RepID=UPI000FE64388|nr:phospholipase D-like domain-containing protein [Mesorhizobium sp.]RWD50456.1 MAG: phosphatidylserine/phosphatidylglycerophosphate/cardiolipin synthase family protein [Mesorhizobium sp.]RWE39597.1 MAG: phosphatidylserine/phosphatidylglycerophosphate/cardiolipin synthase family protein [Mesorhizobium sp.]
MLSRSIDPHELYVRIGNHLAAMPPNMDRYSAQNDIWISKAVAIVEAVGSVPDINEIREAAGWYSAHPEIYASTFWRILQRALARVELAVPAASGSFLPVGSPMDAMTAIGKVLKEAKSRLLIVDPYLDETILTDFAPMSAEGVKIDLLSDSGSVKATLAPAVKRWTAQYGIKRPIEARATAPRQLHDRLIIVDDAKVWNVSQSIKDLAARSPASITVVQGDVAMLKIPAYAEMWNAATALP